MGCVDTNHRNYLMLIFSQVSCLVSTITCLSSQGNEKETVALINYFKRGCVTEKKKKRSELT